MKIKRKYLKETIKQLNAENATLKLWLSTVSDLTPVNKVTRVEVVENDRRHYLNWDSDNIITLQLQDNYQTLKIFINKNK
jgi:hypothetical protein